MRLGKMCGNVQKRILQLTVHFDNIGKVYMKWTVNNVENRLSHHYLVNIFLEICDTQYKFMVWRVNLISLMVHQYDIFTYAVLVSNNIFSFDSFFFCQDKNVIGGKDECMFYGAMKWYREQYQISPNKVMNIFKIMQVDKQYIQLNKISRYVIMQLGSRSIFSKKFSPKHIHE